MKSWTSRLLWKIFREPWWNKKTKVQGKIIDPYSYSRGFEDGMRAMSTPTELPIMKVLSDEELRSLKATWEGVMNSPNIKVGYRFSTKEDKND